MTEDPQAIIRIILRAGLIAHKRRMGVYGDVLHERRKQKKGKTLDRRTAELGNQSLRGAFRSFKVHSGSLHCIQVVTIAAPHLNVLLSDTLPSCAHSASQNHVAAGDNQYTLCQISSSFSVFAALNYSPPAIRCGHALTL